MICKTLPVSFWGDNQQCRNRFVPLPFYERDHLQLSSDWVYTLKFQNLTYERLLIFIFRNHLKPAESDLREQ